MLTKIRDLIVRRFLADWILGAIDSLLKKLPSDDRKTITGILIAMIGVILKELPGSAVYLEPVLAQLRELPADMIVEGGIAWALVGIFHKLVKWVRSLLIKHTEPVSS